METCEACGVVKIGSMFKPSVGDVMTAKAFQQKCCQYAKRPGCINLIKVKPSPVFDGSVAAKGSTTEAFLTMAKELRSDLIKDGVIES